MKRKRFCSLIVIPPEKPGVLKLHVTRTAIGLLLAIAAVACLVIVGLAYYFPPAVNDQAHQHLEIENARLRAAVQNAKIQTNRLSTDITELEEKTQRIEELIISD